MNSRNFARRQTMLLWALALTLISVPFVNWAEGAEFPTKPLELVIQAPPGGDSDTSARLIVEKMRDYLSQPVTVVNKPGGGTVIGTLSALSAPADGYTIITASSPMMTAPFLRKGVRYNLLKDFTPINVAVTCPQVLIVKGDAPWKTVEEFIADAKKRPGEITIAIPAYGATAHFISELFKMNMKTDVTIVPKEGTGQCIPAVLGGHINAFFPEVGIMQKYIEAGSFRALAVTSDKRHKDLPNVPTFAEKGFPDIETYSYIAYLVRSETPSEIVERLAKAFKETLKDKELTGAFEKMGFSVVNYGPKESAEFLAKQEEKVLKIIKAANMGPKE